MKPIIQQIHDADRFYMLRLGGSKHRYAVYAYDEVDLVLRVLWPSDEDAANFDAIKKNLYYLHYSKRQDSNFPVYHFAIGDHGSHEQKMLEMIQRNHPHPKKVRVYTLDGWSMHK